MAYDHIIKAGQVLTDQWFHLSCGYDSTTSFFFEEKSLAVTIDCNGTFTFQTADGQKQTVKAKPMCGGRGCYMDIYITNGEELLFRLPEYNWWDNYPNCDGESDRWDADVIGTRDEIRFRVGA